MTLRFEIGNMVCSSDRGTPYKKPYFPIVVDGEKRLYTDPVHQVCRDLLKAGKNASCRVEFMRNGKVTYTGTVGGLATRTTIEPDAGTISIQKFVERTYHTDD